MTTHRDYVQAAMNLIDKLRKDSRNDKKTAIPRLDLHGADLTRISLIGMYLAHANLRETRLGFATLTEADLSGANLESANLHRAFLQDSNLSRANIREAILSDTNLSGANLSPRGPERCRLHPCRIWRSRFVGCPAQQYKPVRRAFQTGCSGPRFGIPSTGDPLRPVDPKPTRRSRRRFLQPSRH